MSEDVIYRILFPIVVGALIAECASKKHCPHCGRKTKEYIDCCIIGELMDID